MATVEPTNTAWYHTYYTNSELETIIQPFTSRNLPNGTWTFEVLESDAEMQYRLTKDKDREVDGEWDGEENDSL